MLFVFAVANTTQHSLPSSGSPLGPAISPQLLPLQSAPLPRHSVPAPGSAKANPGQSRLQVNKQNKNFVKTCLKVGLGCST